MIRYILIFLAFLIIWIVWYLKSNNINIKFRSFFKKGFLVDTGPYGVYCYCGKQGTGKTYSVVEFLQENKDCKIYANLKKLENVPYIYIGSFEELLDIKNDSSDNIIIFYDEIFTALAKQDKMTKEVLSFLSQMRKRKIIFLTTAQEWLEIHITLRRYVRFQIECSIKSFFGRSYLFKSFFDAEQMKWSNLDNEYVAPLVSFTLSKMNKSIADSYDTYEVIESSNKFYSIRNKSKSFLLSDLNQQPQQQPLKQHEQQQQEQQQIKEQEQPQNNEIDSQFWEEEESKLIEEENTQKLNILNLLSGR